MKRTLILFLLIWLGGGENLFASPDPNEMLVKQQLEHLNLDEIEQYWQKLYQDYHGFLPEVKSPGLISLMLQQEKGFSLQGVLNGFLHFLFHVNLRFL